MENYQENSILEFDVTFDITELLKKKGNPKTRLAKRTRDIPKSQVADFSFVKDFNIARAPRSSRAKNSCFFTHISNVGAMKEWGRGFLGASRLAKVTSLLHVVNSVRSPLTSLGLAVSEK